MELLEYLALAFAGGLILNVMPCVLPVLTLKVVHAVEVGLDARTSRLHGIAYGLGTLAAFVAFALVVIGLRTSGESLGWGMQFQHPPFLAAMVVVTFVFGLNALGVFEITVSADGGDGGGVLGSFVNGVFAAILATPCSAPFLGTAAVAALGMGAQWWETLILFLGIGAGLATPFLIISFVPAFGRWLPRPGKWMLAAKQLTGFTLVGAAVWLFGSLQRQLTPEAANGFLWFLLAIAVGVWAIDRFAALHHATGRRWTVRALVLAGLVLSGRSLLSFEHAAAATVVTTAATHQVVSDGRINWVPFDPARVTDEQRNKRPVFVDYTADWCAACKTNEKVFLETEPVRSALLRTNILPMKADMTLENEMIEASLNRLGRNGIPAYVIYMPDGTHDLLPITITADMVVERLLAAATKVGAVADHHVD